MEKNPTIVQVWQYEYANYKSSFWGIGDLIRGVVCLRNYCRQKNYNYVLDVHNHDISKFIKYNNTTFSYKVNELGVSIPFCISFDDIERLITDSDIVFCNTNYYDKEQVDEEDKQFIRELFLLKDEYEADYNDNYGIPGKYMVLHYRLGDDLMFSDVLYGNFDKVYNSLRAHPDLKTILCTDNQTLKNNKPEDIICPKKTRSCHLGKKSFDDECLKYTLYDLILISRSSLIRSYTKYAWASGFSAWIAKCYNISIEPISI